MFELRVSDVSKRFGSRKVFSQLAFELRTGESLAVVGPNGSGKSTLLLTLLSLYRPNQGSVTYYQGKRRLEAAEVRAVSSFVAPYLHLYDQLTAEENLKFFATVGGYSVTGKQVDELLHRVGLGGRGCDLVGVYSSGMKQRLKFAVALLKSPAFLFLDEPGSNLDESGQRIVTEIINECRSHSIIVIATNDREESSLAEKQLRLGG